MSVKSISSDYATIRWRSMGEREREPFVRLTVATNHPVSAFLAFASRNVFANTLLSWVKGGLGKMFGLRKVRRCLMAGESLILDILAMRDTSTVGDYRCTGLRSRKPAPTLSLWLFIVMQTARDMQNSSFWHHPWTSQLLGFFTDMLVTKEQVC